MGKNRKIKKNNLDFIIKVRVDEERKEHILDICHTKSITVSKYLRYLIDKDINN